jgi:F0F1-type ATP synthase assembly protein I
MSKAHEPAVHTPSIMTGEITALPADPQKTSDTRQQFVVFALNMSWQLAIAVLIPVIGGVELDKVFKSSETFLFIGLGVALLASAAVLWRTMQAANRLPVPKLTEAQKRAVQKSYEEDDEQ